jgi:hypothetical protein
MIALGASALMVVHPPTLAEVLVGGGVRVGRSRVMRDDLEAGKLSHCCASDAALRHTATPVRVDPPIRQTP